MSFSEELGEIQREVIRLLIRGCARIQTERTRGGAEVPITDDFEPHPETVRLLLQFWNAEGIPDREARWRLVGRVIDSNPGLLYVATGKALKGKDLTEEEFILTHRGHTREEWSEELEQEWSLILRRNWSELLFAHVFGQAERGLQCR